MKFNPGAVLSGRYEISEKIGSGGMAVVYRAKDLKLDRYVTVKVMREEYMSDEEFIKRFGVEARAAASLCDQNIVNVYDVGAEDNAHYIVMEYVNGVTLKELIKKRAPFDSEEILGVAIQIASGIAHAHDHRVIHRDIKPQNILVTSQGVVKVTDFGIARAPNVATTTTSGSMLGSVHYFSPEQARGVFVDEKSDIYSLGIVMYEMATGRLPFDGESAVGVALKQINDPLPPVRDFNPDISERVLQIILKATEKSPSKRYQSAYDMLEDLKKALSGPDAAANGNGAANTGAAHVAITEKENEMIKREAQNLYYDERDGGNESNYGKGFGGYGANAGGKLPGANGKRAGVTESEKKLERNIVIAAICTAVALIAIICAFGIYLYNKNIPKPVYAPEIEGLSLEEGTNQAAGLGLDVVVQDSVNSEDVAAGHIISQNERPGENLADNRTVHVIVSLGTSKIEVPDVKNRTRDDAERIIKNAGFAISENFDYNDVTPQDVCFGQSPEAGTLADPGAVISVTYSIGPQQVSVSVPDVTGLSEPEAIDQLQNLGLVIGKSSKAYSDTVEEGHIITQTIRSGTIAQKGSEISYVVSMGPNPLATQTPEPAASPAPTPAASPEPTPSAQPGGAGAEETQTPEPSAATVNYILNPVIPEGYSTALVRVMATAADGSVRVVFDDRVAVADLPLSVPITGEGTVQVEVYLKAGTDADYHLIGTDVIDFG
ncbi:MAG: Stk1 family PASTA domain-containing Ser/Thr kinase [Firmicutes bacterium]|nr:Stk1 family PASTA domain-containing Ser/Thr kinase [Bacillota bacterium]